MAFIDKDGLMWVVQTHSINAGDLSTIEILISKLVFNIQTLLPDSGICWNGYTETFSAIFFSLGCKLRPSPQRSTIVIQPNDANYSSHRQASQ